MDIKREATIQARMWWLAIKLTFGGMVVIALALILAMWFFATASGQYHCKNEGGYLKGDYCVIEVSK